MTEIIDAIYEGDGLVRLEHEPKGLMPNERVAVVIVQTSKNKIGPVEKVGVRGLHQQLADYEAR